MQWSKGFWSPPKWTVVLLTAVIAILYVVAPEWARNAGGVIAATQVGWDVVMQPAVAGAHALKERVLTAGRTTTYSAGGRGEGL